MKNGPIKLSELASQGEKQQKPVKKNMKGTVQGEGRADAFTGRVISEIEVQQRHKKRYNLYVNERFFLGISEETLVHFGLYKGMDLTEEQLSAIRNKELENRAYQVALVYLSHSLRSKKQIEERLEKEEIEPEYIERTLHRLEELGLVDDVSFGASYVRTQALISRKGPEFIQKELKKKGLTEENIRKALEEYPRQQQLENCRYLADKKWFANQKRYSFRKNQEKTWFYLYSKGFEKEMIQAVISGYKEEVGSNQAALKKELEKYWRKYRYLDKKQKIYKVKCALYRKGFESDEINNCLDQRQEEEELGDCD